MVDSRSMEHLLGWCSGTQAHTMVGTVLSCLYPLPCVDPSSRGMGTTGTIEIESYLGPAVDYLRKLFTPLYQA